MTDDTLVIENSSYCATMNDSAGEEFKISIYKLDHETSWVLEMIDQSNTSFVWCDRFDTDKQAYDEAVAALTTGEAFDKTAEVVEAE